MKKIMNRRTFLIKSAAVAGLTCLNGWEELFAAGKRDIACGKPWGGWKRGQFQIHFIYTGVAESMFLIFPDGTTMLLDCGDELSTEGREPAPVPEAAKGRVADYIADYIERVNPAADPTRVDYMMTSHYHSDHTDGYPKLIDRIRFGKAFDRTWPDVNFPCRIADHQPHELEVMSEVYSKLVKRDGLVIEKWRVGARDQLKLLHGGAKDFSVFNLCANGFVADETTGMVTDLYKDYPDKQPGFKGNKFGKQWINENGMSIGFILGFSVYFSVKHHYGIRTDNYIVWIFFCDGKCLLLGKYFRDILDRSSFGNEFLTAGNLTFVFRNYITQKLSSSRRAGS